MEAGENVGGRLQSSFHSGALGIPVRPFNEVSWWLWHAPCFLSYWSLVSMDSFSLVDFAERMKTNYRNYYNYNHDNHINKTDRQRRTTGIRGDADCTEKIPEDLQPGREIVE